MFLSKEYILSSISKLGEVHPFMGITFLASKKNELPIGSVVEYPMDRHTKSFMEGIHRINPYSRFYFQPFSSNDREKSWVTAKYPSSGLQAINTQTFSNAFLHKKKGKTWGWSSDYVEVIRSILAKDTRIRLIDLAIWIYKGKEWESGCNIQDVLTHFVEEYRITSEEEKHLFTRDTTGYPSVDPFQDGQVVWKDLKDSLAQPPDSMPGRGAALSYLQLVNVGPTKKIEFEPQQRLNIITGDNGLGKSFLLDCAWWTLTGKWLDYPAQQNSSTGKSEIAYALASKEDSAKIIHVVYDAKNGVWPRSEKSPSIPGLIVYARVDGSYAVWDPAKQYNKSGIAHPYDFTKKDVWDGTTGAIEGLIRDWVSWQSTPDRSPYNTLVNVLKRVAPPDMGELCPGLPTRMLNDIREIPTIVHPYGEVPIVNTSAGIRRIITLAYLLVWAWNEHKIASKLTNSKTEKRLVVMIDEIEAHLHPKWQRTILPALIGLQEILSDELEIQFMISTHSPLVLASAEAYFEPSIDGLFLLSIEKEAKLQSLDFIKYGQVSSWLTSPIFNLGQARSTEAEVAIEAAKKLQLQQNPEKDDVARVHEALSKSLAETDAFWPRWIYFAEKNGVSL